MKKIINGKAYDTDTAKQIGERSWGEYVNDLYYVSETLFCKVTGEYFLYGWGGAGSKYSESCGNNSWTSGERIMPMTLEEAKEWAETNLSAESYEAEFGVVSE